MNKDISFVEVLAIIVVILLLTRLPMKRGERPTVSTYMGVIILLHLIHFSALSLVSTVNC